MLYLTRNRAGCGTNGHQDIDRMFEEMTRGLGLESPAHEPPLDISETAGEWRVAMELAGVAPEDVEVSVTENVLTVRGEKKAPTKAEGEASRRDERRYGKFARTLEFPGDVDAQKVAARFQHGVLVVTLAKAEASKPKTIAVKVE